MSSGDETEPKALPPGEPSPARSEIAAEIERARARVAASLTSLGEKVARRSDWRAWVRERPTLVVAGALALGFLCGAEPPDEAGR